MINFEAMKKILGIIALAVLVFTACNKENGLSFYDDLDYFQTRVSGDVLYPDTPDHLYLAVDNLAQAKQFFLQWIAPDVQVTENGGALSCPLTGKDGKSQGTVYFTPGDGAAVAEVTFSKDVRLPDIYQLTFLLRSAWPYNSDDTSEVYDITVNHPDGSWKEGDKVYVFFEKVTGARYLQLEYNGSMWVGNLQGGLTMADITAGGTQMYAVHFPFEQPVIASTGSGVSFRRDADDQVHGQFIYSYYMTADGAYTVETEGSVTTLSGVLDMAIPEGFVKFSLARSGAKYNADFTYRLALAGVTPVACASYNNGKFGTRSLAAFQPMWGFKSGDTGVVFSGVIDNTWSNKDNEHRLYFFDTAAPGKYGTLENKTLSSHDVMEFTASTIASWYQVTTPGTIEYEGTSWALFNIGTNFNSFSEEKSGGWYFMWGDLIPARSMFRSGLPSPYFASTDYYLQTACWDAREGKVADLTGEYCIFDAARAFLGPEWRLPTREEYAIIGKNYFDSFSPNKWWKENLNALYIVDDEVEQNALVLPGAGYWHNGTFDRGVGSKDSDPTHYAGYYWFSTLDRESDAYHFFFNHWLGPWVGVTAEIGPTHGLPIRAVKNK